MDEMATHMQDARETAATANRNGEAEGEDAPAEVSPDNNEIGTLGHHIRELFESKSWERLKEALDLPFVWLVDSPWSVSEALRLAERHLQTATELEVELLRILNSEKSTTPRGSYACCLRWMESDLRQSELEFDLHLGFERTADGGWKISYLGVTKPTPEEVPFPQDEGSESEKETGQDDSGGSFLFGRSTTARSVAGSAENRDAGSDHVLVYVPALFPRDLFKGLVGDPPKKEGQ